MDEVHHALSELIQSGTLEVGGKLPTENALALEHGVSRPVVREAIARLAASGHIRTERGRGSFVTENQGLDRLELPPITSVNDLLDWQELRVGIEQEAARLAAMRHTQKEIDEVVRLHDMMVRGMKPGTSLGDTDHAFHMAIAAASHNRAIVDAQRVLGRHIKGWISAIVHVEPNTSSKRNQYLLSEHHAILSAIKDRDPDRAAVAIRSHIESGRTRFLARLAKT